MAWFNRRPAPDPEPVPAAGSYAALRAHCAPSAARVLARESAAADPASSADRLRGAVFTTLVREYHRTGLGLGALAGVAFINGTTQRQAVCAIPLGTGPDAALDATARLLALPGTAGLSDGQAGQLAGLIPDPMIAAVFEVVVEHSDAERAVVVVSCLFADGSALSAMVSGHPGQPQHDRVVGTDPVDGAAVERITEPTPAPWYPRVAAMLLAALEAGGSLPRSAAPAPAPAPAPSPGTDPGVSSYARFRALCSAKSARVLGREGPDADPVAATERLRRVVLSTILKDFHRTGTDQGVRAGLVFVNGTGPTTSVCTAAIGAGAGALEEARGRVVSSPGTVGLSADHADALVVVVPDPLVAAVFQTQIHYTGADRLTLVADFLCADGSAFSMIISGHPDHAEVDRLMGTDLVDGVRLDHLADPEAAPWYLGTAALLTAALGAHSTFPSSAPRPAPPSELDLAKADVLAMLHRAWPDAYENDRGAFVVHAWSHAAVLVEVVPTEDGFLVADLRAPLATDVPVTADVHEFVARGAVRDPLVSVGMLGADQVTVSYEHSLVARDLAAESLHRAVQRLGALADAHALDVCARLGGAPFVRP